MYFPALGVYFNVQSWLIIFSDAQRLLHTSGARAPDCGLHLTLNSVGVSLHSQKGFQWPCSGAAVGLRVGRSLSLCTLQVSGQKEVCAECVCAASLSAPTADRGPAGCKDPGQRHTGRPAQGTDGTAAYILRVLL